MTHRNWTRHDLERLLDGDLPAHDVQAIEHDLHRDAALRTRLDVIRTLDEAIADALQPEAAPVLHLKRAPAPTSRRARRPVRRTAQPLKAILLAAASVVIVVGAGMYFAPRTAPDVQRDVMRVEAQWKPSRVATTRRFDAAPLNVQFASRSRIASESGHRTLPSPAPLRVSTPSLLASRSAANAKQSNRVAAALQSTSDARALFDGLSSQERIVAAEHLMRDPGLRFVAFQELARLRSIDAPDRHFDELVRRMEKDPELRIWAVAYQLTGSAGQPARSITNGT